MKALVINMMHAYQNVIMIMQKIIWIVCFVCDKYNAQAAQLGKIKHWESMLYEYSKS